MNETKQTAVERFAAFWKTQTHLHNNLVGHFEYEIMESAYAAGFAARGVADIAAMTSASIVGSVPQWIINAIGTLDGGE